MTYLAIKIIFIFIFFKFHLICHVATFNWAICHNFKPYKWTIIKYGGNWYLKKKRNFNQKFPLVGCVIFWWIDEKWHYHGSCKLLALELPEFHMYMVSHKVTYIHCNLCNLFDSTHTHRNMLSCKWMANGHHNSKF
jgi:hypothetical protein